MSNFKWYSPRLIITLTNTTANIIIIAKLSVFELILRSELIKTILAEGVLMKIVSLYLLIIRSLSKSH